MSTAVVAIAAPGYSTTGVGNLNGVLLLAFESLRKRQPAPGDGEGDSDPRIATRMSFRQAAAIGTAQAAALIPGISRSGVTMGGGLKCWGSNNNGQVGFGSSAVRWVPVDVVGLAAAASIALGNDHTCALTPAAY